MQKVEYVAILFLVICLNSVLVKQVKEPQGFKNQTLNLSKLVRKLKTVGINCGTMRSLSENPDATIEFSANFRIFYVLGLTYETYRSPLSERKTMGWRGKTV